MERITRKPFQGVTNIIRFNWHFYALAAAAILTALSFAYILGNAASILLVFLSAGVLVSTFGSLVVSWYIYDHSNLYRLNWLDGIIKDLDGKLVNLNAGFDETSHLLAAKYSRSDIAVLDFYDPAKHTEVSIKRARQAYPPYPGTLAVSTQSLPLAKGCAGNVFSFLAAHEIRNYHERVQFFQQIKGGLKPGGLVVVVEHLRDTANFLAFNIGFLHFYSRKEWLRTFHQSGLAVQQEIKITPFISAFILRSHGDTN